MLSFGLSLWYCHKLSDVFHNYCCTPYYTLASQYQDPLYCLLEIYSFCWCIQWMVHNFWMLLAFFFRLHSLLLHLILFQNFQSSLYKYVRITLVTKTWTYHGSLGLNFIPVFYFSRDLLFTSTHFFVLNFDGSLLVFYSEFIILWYSIFCI